MSEGRMREKWCGVDPQLVSNGHDPTLLRWYRCLGNHFAPSLPFIPKHHACCGSSLTKGGLEGRPVRRAPANFGDRVQHKGEGTGVILPTPECVQREKLSDVDPQCVSNGHDLALLL